MGLDVVGPLVVAVVDAITGDVVAMDVAIGAEVGMTIDVDVGDDVVPTGGLTIVSPPTVSNA
jgi:hypothetical protein